MLNKNQGAIAQAQARRREAAASFNALQARVLGEIDLALATYRAALLTRSEADATLDNLQKQERRGQAMLGAGEISRGDLAALRLLPRMWKKRREVERGNKSMFGANWYQGHRRTRPALAI